MYQDERTKEAYIMEPTGALAAIKLSSESDGRTVVLPHSIGVAAGLFRDCHGCTSLNNGDIVYWGATKDASGVHNWRVVLKKTTVEARRVHLQGIGKQKAKMASEFRPGDTTVWNYGYTAKVLEVEQKGRYLYFKLEAAERFGSPPQKDAKPYNIRKMLPTTLVAYTGDRAVMGLLSGEDCEEAAEAQKAHEAMLKEKESEALPKAALEKPYSLHTGRAIYKRGKPWLVVARDEDGACSPAEANLIAAQLVESLNRAALHSEANDGRSACVVLASNPSVTLE